MFSCSQTPHNSSDLAHTFGLTEGWNDFGGLRSRSLTYSNTFIIISRHRVDLLWRWVQYVCVKNPCFIMRPPLILMIIGSLHFFFFFDVLWVVLLFYFNSALRSTLANKIPISMWSYDWIKYLCIQLFSNNSQLMFAYILISAEQMHTSKQCMSSVIWLTCGSGYFHTTTTLFSTWAPTALGTERHAGWLTVTQVRSEFD